MPLKWISTFVVLLLFAGVVVRRRRRLHVSIMLCALVIDLAIVAYIELDRDAFRSAGEKMGPLMAVHIALSVAVLVLYGVQVVSGIRRLRGQSGPWHAKVPIWFFAARIGNLITSFFVM